MPEAGTAACRRAENGRKIAPRAWHGGRLCAFSRTNERSPRTGYEGFSIGPGGDLLSHGQVPHYHRRKAVSRSCSGWEGVVPARYGRQGKGLVAGTYPNNQKQKKQQLQVRFCVSIAHTAECLDL